MKIYRKLTELIGATPLLKLYGPEKTGNGAAVYGKMECFNPAGSVKDRVALALIEDAEQRGMLKEDSVIIEPTSGNTGIGLCAVAAAKGYRTMIVMPDTMSVERRRLMAAYGAEIVLTDGAKGMQGAIDKAEELRSAHPRQLCRRSVYKSSESRRAPSVNRARNLERYRREGRYFRCRCRHRPVRLPEPANI